MAVTLKTQKQIDLLRSAGRIVAETFEVLREHVKPGVSTADLDRLAEEYIRKQGGEPVYKGYGATRGGRGQPSRPAFPATICASVNEVICHGIPNPKHVLKDGDIIGVDIGVRYKGWVGDSCVTFAVGNVAEEVQHLLDVTEQSLALGIEQARVDNTLGDIGAVIQHHAESHGFSVVREYTGHGVGRNLHEEPTVLHYGKPGTGRKILAGMVFTIEPMINMGTPATRQDPDGWTVRTADKKYSAQFEHELAITDDGPIILTRC
jgi:methionyl aminopeptidase